MRRTISGMIIHLRIKFTVVIDKIFFSILHLYLKARIGKPLKLMMLGTHYGGWNIPESTRLGPDSVCYLAGAGEDISFDCSLAKIFQAQVHIFDPTPRAVEHFTTLSRSVAAGHAFYINNANDFLYDIDKDVLDNITYHAWGLAAADGDVRFYFPQDETHVSCSYDNIHGTEKFFMASCYRLDTIRDKLRHKEIDLVKLDIEGAEYDVIPDMLKTGIIPAIFAVEFHKLSPIDFGAAYRIFRMIIMLENHGMKLICMNELDATFIKKEQG